MPLDDIIEDDYMSGTHSEYSGISSDSGFVSGSVMYAGGRGRQDGRIRRSRRRRVGGSDTEASSMGKRRHGKRRKGSKRSKVAKRAEIQRKRRLKSRLNKSGKTTDGSDTGAAETETETEIDAEGAVEDQESSASEDSFDELTPEEVAAMDDVQKAEYSRRKRMSEIRSFKELSEVECAALDAGQREAYEKLKAEAMEYRAERKKRKATGK